MPEPASPAIERSRSVAEVLILAAITGLIVWSAAPDVNEAHYLCKARHFWNRDWCANDLFVSSHETHWLFYLFAGWPTRWISLELTAWLGRVVAWLTVSWGLVRLTRVLTGSRPGISLAIVPVVILLNRHLHLAGEWFVGGFEGKAIAWGFVFAAIAGWLDRRPNQLCLCLAVACGFHIVLGLWVVLVLIFAGLLARFGAANRTSLSPVSTVERSGNGQPTIPVILVSLTLVFAGIWPAVNRNPETPPDIVQQANQVQAFSRLAHHQDAMQFQPERWIAFLTLVAIWLVLVWSTWSTRTRYQSQLNRMVVGALCLNLLGTLISAAALLFPATRPLAAQMLVLYWFRLADVLVPLAVACNGALLVRHLRPRIPEMRWATAVCLLVTALAVGWNGWHNWNDPRSGSARQAAGMDATSALAREIQVERNWRRLCRWISDNTPHDAVFITPVDQQTFKWHASRAEVACWKDMPQDAASVVQWDTRMRELYRSVPQQSFGILGLLNHQIRELARKYDARFLIVETRFVDRRNQMGYPADLDQVYPLPGTKKSTFTIFRFPPDVNRPSPARSQTGQAN